MQSLTLPPSLLLRRFCCRSAATSSPSKKKQVVFLGSPLVAASVLDTLLSASSASDSLFEVAAIVTQPPSGRDRGRKVLPSHVAQLALDRGFPPDLIFTPVRASEKTFLSNFKALRPGLCITAAYGNILPSKFLKIPSLGTVNIHPSLLPLYRGAAPVQRALEDGVKETGVSLAFTVRALDAGPVIAHEKMEIDNHIKAPELLELLFSRGYEVLSLSDLVHMIYGQKVQTSLLTIDCSLVHVRSELLIRELPFIFDGSAMVKAQAQDDSRATLAPKIAPEESWLSFDEEASVLHNKVRAFAGWPGTRARVIVMDGKNTRQNILELKIITTRVHSSDSIQGGKVDDVIFTKGSMVFPCGGCTELEVLEVQLPGKKVASAASFWNGLRGQKLKKL